MHLSFLILITLFSAIFEAAILPPNPEEQLTKSKTEAPSLSLAESGSVSIRPLWTISEYKVTKGAVWGENDASKFLFKPLAIEESKITFNGQTCQNVTFEKRTASAKEYLANTYSTTPHDSGITEELIEVVKTNCTLPGFAEYIRLKDRRIVIYLNGVFFYFTPSVTY